MNAIFTHEEGRVFRYHPAFVLNLVLYTAEVDAIPINCHATMRHNRTRG